MNKISTQLATFVKWEKTTVGAKNLPAVNVHYVRKDGKDAGKEMSVRYLVGTLDESSGAILKTLKEGMDFVIVKEETPNPKDPTRPYWNLKEFKSADGFVPKTAYVPHAGYGGAGGAKSEFNTIGIKVGAARNQSIAFLSATKGANFTLDDIDAVAYDIIKRQQVQEDNVKNNTIPTTKVNLANEENDKNNQHFEQEEDDDIPF